MRYQKINLVNFTHKLLSLIIVITLILSNLTIPSKVYAQGLSALPPIGTMITLTPAFSPVMLRGVKVNMRNPFKFDFIVDTGNSTRNDEGLNQETIKLIKYFLATLTIPEKDLWVNLSPYEQNRIAPKLFGSTEMGRDLLSQDYMLKQLTASLFYPKKEIGEKFWKAVYQKASKKFNTTKIPMNTFNKVWIVPDTAVVFEHETSAFVVESHLKVMLEEDYIASQKNISASQQQINKENSIEKKATSEISTDIIREIIIPEIEKEVNNGATFANLRQIYNAMILATWYKMNMRQSILGTIYMDQNKTGGIDAKDKMIKEKIYKRYLEAFKTGIYNYIHEDYNEETQQIIPRKYFSGGFEAMRLLKNMRILNNTEALSPAQFITFLSTIGFSDADQQNNAQLYEDIQATFRLFSGKDQSEIMQQLKENSSIQKDGKNAVLLYTIALLENDPEIAAKIKKAELGPNDDKAMLSRNKDAAIQRFRTHFNEIVNLYKKDNYESAAQLLILLHEATNEFQELMVRFDNDNSVKQLAKKFQEQKNILESELHASIFSRFNLQEDIDTFIGTPEVKRSKKNMVLTYLTHKMTRGQTSWNPAEIPALLDILSKLQNKEIIDASNDLFETYLRQAPSTEIENFLKEILPFLIVKTKDIRTFSACKNFLIDLLKHNPYSRDMLMNAPRRIKKYGVELFESRNVYVPVDLHEWRNDGNTDQYVLLKTEDTALALKNEIDTGRIKKISGKYYFPVKIPLPFKLHSEIHNRSSEFLAENNAYVYKGTGTSKGAIQKNSNIVSNYVYGARGPEYAFYGGLPLRQSSIVHEIILRKAYNTLKAAEDPALILAEEYGANIDMLLNPIAEATINALPVLNLPNNDNPIAKKLISAEITVSKAITPPKGIHLIPTKKLLNFVNVPKDITPAFHIYNAPVNIRLEQITQAKNQNTKAEFLKPIFKYYGLTLIVDSSGDFTIYKNGETVTDEEIAQKILFTAAARYALFIHILHGHLNGQAHEDVYTVFSEHNCNPITLFDYDTVSYNNDYKDDSKRQGVWARDTRDAQKILWKLANELGVSQYMQDAKNIFQEILLADNDDDNDDQNDKAMFSSKSIEDESPIKAPETVGGINLNSAMMKMQIQRDNNGIPLPIDQQPIKNMNIDGLLPVIINITPLQTLQFLLGTINKDPTATLPDLASSST